MHASGSLAGGVELASAGAAHAIEALTQQVGGVDAAELLGAGVHVDELLRRPRRHEQLVAAGRHLAEARADREHEVGVARCAPRAWD